MNNLCVIAPCPLKRAYTNKVQAKAKAARAATSRKIDQIQQIVAKVLEGNKELLDSIVQTKIRIRLLQKGVPATESLEDEVSPFSEKTTTDLFLLKKAYRLAASIAHPDKGGSEDEFYSVKRAYENGDIESLQFYYKLKQEDGFDPLGYYQNEIQKAAIDWITFQTTPEYDLARLHMQGHTDEAKRKGRLFLEAVHRLLSQEERTLIFNQAMKRKHV